MMAAITAKKNGNDVIIIEKNNTLGKKLLITGKGRCNITSSLPIKEFIENVPGNGMFLYSAFNNFTNQDIIKLLNEKGLKVKEERGNRIFPVTDSAKDVLECFIKELKKQNIQIYYNTEVTNVIKEQNKFKIKTNKEEFIADKVIIATGGKSYPLTGSTGDGYRFAESFGHTITKIKPSLVPLEIYEDDLCKKSQGLSLKNVKIIIKNTENNKILYEDFGEMIFTHFGVSGPIILSGSAHLVRVKNIEKLLIEKKIKLIIDLKPALTEEKLNLRILRDFEEYKNKDFKNSLEKILPQKLIETIIEKSEINPVKKVNSITKQERNKLVEVFKKLEFTIKDFRKIDEAIITAGGVNIKEINPKTMESKIIEGLYFVGEVLDVDAYTGGFNLQIAYSTGNTAGNSIK